MWIKKELIKQTTETLRILSDTNQQLSEIVKDMKDIVSCYQTACSKILKYKNSPEDIEECAKLALILDTYYKGNAVLKSERSIVGKAALEFIGTSNKKH